MNTSLAGLVSDVYALTNRPDLVSETLLAVRNATLKAHRTDFYPKDLFETGIQFGYAQQQQTLDYRTLVPNWRALKYLREFYPSNLPEGDGTAGVFLDVVTPEDLLNSYGQNKTNVCYLAGAEIKIKAARPAQYYLLGCYVYPTVTEDKFNSWIANENPMAIVYEAAATIFKTIGNDEQVATYSRLVQEEYQQLKQNIIANGY